MNAEQVIEPMAHEPHGTTNNPTCLVRPVEPVRISAQEVGYLLANSAADQQSAIFAWFADAIVKWSHSQSWSMQSRFIAESLSDAECSAVASLLEELMDHLRSIPRERKEQPA